ncbi:hypothetical protein B0H19DRAFT_516739 [Mycena capillaripes]|nr:hypothetical protein B0H19DRAFT_516739 [Mycena capillaripes]
MTVLYFAFPWASFTFEMPSITEASLSLLAYEQPTSATHRIVLMAIFGLIIVLALIYYMSPIRLTRVLVAALVATEKIYLEALDAGLLSHADVHIAEILSCLQLKVSKIREASLRNSLSWGGALGEFFSGRTFTVLQCIWDVRILATHIEILKEAHLRENSSNPLATRAVSLRRRSGGNMTQY